MTESKIVKSALETPALAFRPSQNIVKKISPRLITVHPQTSSDGYAALYNKSLASWVSLRSNLYFSSSNTPAYANAWYACPSPKRFPHRHWCKCHYWTRLVYGRYNTLYE